MLIASINTELPDDPRVTAGVKKIRKNRIEFERLPAELRELIKEIQKNCQHDMMGEFIYDDRYVHAGEVMGEKILDHKICLKCKIVVERPKGTPWQTCHKCWGRMKHDGFIPGQGGRTHIDKCEDCGQRQVRVANHEYVKVGDDVKTATKK